MANREQVKSLMLEGYTITEIAKELGIKKHTVKWHFSSLYKEAGISGSKGSKSKQKFFTMFAKEYFAGKTVSIEAKLKARDLEITNLKQEIFNLKKAHDTIKGVSILPLGVRNV